MARAFHPPTPTPGKISPLQREGKEDIPAGLSQQHVQNLIYAALDCQATVPGRKQFSLDNHLTPPVSVSVNASKALKCGADGKPRS